MQYRFTNLDQLASYFTKKGAQLRASIKQREAGNTPAVLSRMNRQRVIEAAIWEQAASVIRNTKLDNAQ